MERAPAFDENLVQLLRQDPYPVYAQLRQAGRVLWTDQPGLWIVSGHREAAALLNNPQTSVEGGGTLEAQARERRSMLDLDPPDHTRLRSLVHRAFTPRVVAGLEGRIREIVDECCDCALRQGGMDLMADLARPLPIIVIAELLGVPPEDMDVFRGWSDDLVGSLEPLVSRAEQARAEAAGQQLRLYLAGVIDRRRHDPGEDLLTRLVAVEAEGDRLSSEELVSMAVLLLAAGHETTVNLIGNGVRALLHHPDQMERLRRGEVPAETAVEELLRFDSPVQMTSRIPTSAVELDGNRIPEGQRVMLLLGAANHDPEEFSEPEQLDLGRRPNRHLSFSRGIHFCLGAPLARLEGQIAITTIARRLPTLHDEGKAVRTEHVNLRGFASMPLLL